MMELPEGLIQIAGLFDCLEETLAWVKDRENRYRWVNRAFLLRYAMARPVGSDRATVAEIVGRTDYDLSPGFLADQFRIDDEHVLAGHRIVHRIELVGERDEDAAWSATDKIPLFGGDGAIIGTAGMTRRLDGPGRPVAPGSEFGPALAHLREHYGSSITNRELARLSHMSVRAFERKFAASFHLTPQRYLRKLRLRLASRALVYSDRTLAEVAIDTGFSDQSHFTREFRRHFGRTPRDYREHHARDDSGPSRSVPAALVPKAAAVEQDRARPGGLD